MAKVSTNRKNILARRRMRVYRKVKSRKSEQQNVHLDTHNQRTQSPQTEIRNYSELNNKLRTWISRHNISQRAVNDLFSILIAFGLIGLPKDCRTLVRTPQNIIIRTIAGGQYWYNGIEHGIRLSFSKIISDVVLQLNISIDGLPVFNNSATTFWPILANFHSKYLLSNLKRTHIIDKDFLPF